MEDEHTPSAAGQPSGEPLQQPPAHPHAEPEAQQQGAEQTSAGSSMPQAVMSRWQVPNARNLVAMMFALALVCIGLLVVALWVVNSQQINNDAPALSSASTSSSPDPAGNQAGGVSGTKGSSNPKDGNAAGDTSHLQPVTGVSYLTKSTLSLKPEKTSYQGVQDLDGQTVPAPGSGEQASTIAEQVRVFARALSNKDSELINKTCWMVPPLVRQDRYLSEPAQLAIFHALETAPVADERGLSWQGKLLTVFVPWGASKAQAQCPQVRLGGELDQPTADTVKYLLTRLVSRSEVPVNAADKETDFPLLCPDFAAPKGFLPAGRQASALSVDGEGKVSHDQKKTLLLLRDSRLGVFTAGEGFPRYYLATVNVVNAPGVLLRQDADGAVCLGSLVDR